MMKNKLKDIFLTILLMIVVGTQPTSLFYCSSAESIIGLGVSGPYPMIFIAEKDVGKIEGYLNIVNDGGTTIGYYNVSIQGQIADLSEWVITINPDTFTLEPEKSQIVNISIICTEVIGEFTGQILVSAYSKDPAVIGTGIAEISVPITIRLTMLGMILQGTDLGTITEITRPELFTINNPAIIDSNPNATCTLSITQISQPCKITVENISSLPSEVDSPSGDFNVIGNYLKIVSNTSITFDAVLKVTYNPDQLIEDKLDAEIVNLYIWEGKWISLESEINTEANFISANIDQFGYFAVMIRSEKLFYTEWWFWFSIIVVVTSTVVLARTIRRNK